MECRPASSCPDVLCTAGCGSCCCMSATNATTKLMHSLQVVCRSWNCPVLYRCGRCHLLRPFASSIDVGKPPIRVILFITCTTQPVSESVFNRLLTLRRTNHQLKLVEATTNAQAVMHARLGNSRHRTEAEVPPKAACFPGYNLSWFIVSAAKNILPLSRRACPAPWT